MLLSIIIINYKTAKLIENCILSIEKDLGKKLGKDVEIVVVDNDSGESDVKALQKLRDKKGFKLLISKINLGFARGVNFGTTMSEGKILLFLNSDTKVDGGIWEMAQFLNTQKNIGILGGKLVDDGGVQEKSAGRFYGLLGLFLMLYGGQRLGIDRDAPKETKKVDWVSGGFMMVKTSLFNELSGFNEKYFMYLEDMDLCLRAKSKGSETYFFADSQVMHAQHGSSNRSFAILNIYRSLLIFYKENKGKLGYNIAIILLYTKAFLAFWVGKVIGNTYLVQTYEEVLKLF